MSFPTTHIWIGYDSREPEVFAVAKFTLEKYATCPIKVHKLEHRDLRRRGLFWRSWTIDANGQYIDNTDGKPFSTEFSHSRFLVPELWRQVSDPDKSPLAMFVDSDFLYLDDIKLMFEEIEEQKRRTNSRLPLYCVQHNYEPKETHKMDGVAQTSYSYKLWSSLMVWDMDHSDNDVLIPETVNNEPGGFLHGFKWLLNRPEKIGVIGERWNFIPNHSEKRVSRIGAIHYTTGGPNFPEYRDCRYANLWLEAYNEYFSSKVRKIAFNTDDILDKI